MEWDQQYAEAGVPTQERQEMRATVEMGLGRPLRPVPKARSEPSSAQGHHGGAKDIPIGQRGRPPETAAAPIWDPGQPKPPDWDLWE